MSAECCVKGGKFSKLIKRPKLVNMDEMEDAELRILANLIDSDDDLCNSEFASLDTNQGNNSYSSDKNHDISDNKDKEKNIPVDEESSSNKENVSKKLTEMENYIKFLESQLKTQNSHKSKSPETNNDTASDKRSAPKTETTTSLSNHKTPSKKINKENRPSSEKTPTAGTTPQPLRDTGIVKKPRVARTPKSSESPSSQKNDSGKKQTGIKRKAEGPVPQASAPKKPVQELNGVTDGFSGLKILNPLVSSASMERRMEGRKIIKVSSIQSNIRNNDIEGNWVTIGVLIQKLPPKTSVKGSQYSIWKISDLAFHLENSIVSLFLFGETHKEHWKTSEGTVIALLNPSVMPPREKQSKEVALTVDNPKKVMMMGVSEDFGRCQGARKADGRKCSNFINKSFGDFCEYHVRREYSKVRSKRMECQQGYGAPSKPPGSKLKNKIASETFFYGGSTVSTYVPPPRQEKVTLKSLASKGVSSEHLNAWKGKQKEKLKTNGGGSPQDQDGPSEDFLNLLKVPTVGSRNLMRQLHHEEEKKDVKETRQFVSASEFLKANKLQPLAKRKTSPTAATTASRASTQTSSSNTLPKTPVLGRGLSCNDDLIFDENIPLNTTKRSTSLSKGKRDALALVRDVGPFTPKDPNDARTKKPSPKLQQVIKTKLEAEESTVSDIGKTSSFTLASGFDLDSEEGQKILKARSRHVGEVKQAEMEQEQFYFKSREKKEAMEAKMLTIKELKVKVVQCSECKYVAEKASERCKEGNHKLKSIEVFKKFFACRECRERTVTYGKQYPTHECRKCGSRNYEKSSMWQEKNGPKIGRETLLLRGPEYAKFLNSLETPKTNGILPKYL